MCDSDDLNVVVEAKELEALAHCVLVWPEASCGGFIDHGDLGAVFTIRAVELPPAQDRNAHRLEIVRRNVVCLSQDPIPCRGAFFPFREDAARNCCAPEEWNIGAQSDRIEAGQ